ncbi:hypothetical protein vseg_020926 [Gypsophila vaccaria]
MERRGSSGGGCCIASARYTPSYPYYYTNDVSKMEQIMLRFRPIAPKPATSGPNSSGSSSGTSIAPTGGGKRKRKAANTTNKRRRKSTSPDDQKSVASSSCHVVTLPLLPETPDLLPITNNNTIYGPKWLCFGPTEAQEVVQSTVTIEGVSDAWLKENVPRCTDEERTRMLEEDTCPGFITDRWDRVWWTNKEYRKMIGGDGETRPVVVVRVESREGVEVPTAGIYGAFTCRVRVQCGGHTTVGAVVPCDAWRMSGGGCAWRLDVKAALSLSL